MEPEIRKDYSKQLGRPLKAGDIEFLVSDGLTGDRGCSYDTCKWEEAKELAIEMNNKINGE